MAIHLRVKKKIKGVGAQLHNSAGELATIIGHNRGTKDSKAIAKNKIITKAKKVKKLRKVATKSSKKAVSKRRKVKYLSKVIK